MSNTKDIAQAIIAHHDYPEGFTATKELIEAIREDGDQFDKHIEYANCEYRVIDSKLIDEIMRDELESDLYMLGCFNAWFLADILGTGTDTIETLQNSEAFEGLGKMIVNGGHLEELQKAYVSADSYGHHFASYDGEETELNGWYVFRTN